MIRNEKIIKINVSDNVAVTLEEIKSGEIISLDNQTIVAKENIDVGHKIALENISSGENVIKYGYPIGHATKDIAVGEHIHSHNLKTNLKGILDYTYNPKLSANNYYNLELDSGNDKDKNKDSTSSQDFFLGYPRENGSVGVRNEIWIVNTVGCVNKTAEILANRANKLYTGKTDGIFSFSHPFGCSQLGDDHLNTQKILSALVNHPNAAGVLVLGLGCENNNIPEFKKVLGDYNSNRVKFLVTQEVEDELDTGIKLIGELVQYANSFTKEPCPLSKLVVGLKCGGSDGFSGITANPLVGIYSDMLISKGGTTILTEVPEMFGAETILMDRCINENIFDKTVNLINDFKGYFIKHDQEVYENPSPGNKKGGISTLEEKSLGCTQKGGNSEVVDVLDYAEMINYSKQGLHLLKSPGNDIVATTALTAAGAQIILFTTGRGTPLGAPVPTIKISTNTELWNKKHNWIDFNAGKLLDVNDVKVDELKAKDTTNMETISKGFFQFVLRVASGEIKAKNELNGYREISIFKDGVIL